MTAVPSPAAFGPEAFRTAMRAPASSVVIVATGAGDRRAGCTVTAICSLSDSPPALLVCLNRKSSALTEIIGNARFSASYLEDGQSRIAEIFAGRTGQRGSDRFGADWVQSPHGVPILQGAAAIFECELTETREFGSHMILIGRILDGAAQQEKRPLVYCQGDYNRLA